VNTATHKKLRLVMAAVAPLPLPQRLSVLHMAWQLVNQKVVDEHLAAMGVAGEQKEQWH
jgi:hypothetical protein